MGDASFLGISRRCANSIEFHSLALNNDVVITPSGKRVSLVTVVTSKGGKTIDYICIIISCQSAKKTLISSILYPLSSTY
jgi:hypothetical protein